MGVQATFNKKKTIVTTIMVASVLLASAWLKERSFQNNYRYTISEMTGQTKKARSGYAYYYQYKAGGETMEGIFHDGREEIVYKKGERFFARFHPEYPVDARLDSTLKVPATLKEIPTNGISRDSIQFFLK